ncbi:hypothetical protein JHK82_017526 [Glycine max]|nr:hypothetical protein JHK85_017963 [Glycine max]KAG5141831.1 hypothetical protein JHK82_017526 [Glycine max]
MFLWGVCIPELVFDVRAKQKQKLFVGVLFLEFSAGDLVGKPELSEARDLNCEDGFKFNKGEAAEQCCCCRWS